MSKYIEKNREHWNELTDIHKESKFYNLNAFKKGESSLRKLEIDEVGNVRGKSLLHLQCHFGKETMSWARLGAKAIGVDISDDSIKLARELAKDLDLDAKFIRSDVYDLPKVLNKKFDVVFTSGGVLCWLPDLKKWARIINSSLKHGGIFYIREEHPISRMYNEQFRPRSNYYFNTKKPIYNIPKGSYADRKAKVKNPSYHWHHTMSNIIDALVDAGLEIEFFHEFPFISYERFPKMRQDKERWWRFKDKNFEIPLTFSIKARKR